MCNAPPQWLRMRHQSHQSHRQRVVSASISPLVVQCHDRAPSKTLQGFSPNGLQGLILMASKGLSFRLQAPTFVPLKGERPRRPREYWPEKNFKWPDVKEDPRPAWRLFPPPCLPLEGSPPIPMHGQGRRLHRPLQRVLVPTAGGVDEGWVDGHP